MPAESTATAALWQQEQRRRALLQQLGVTPLISRHHVAGAATTRWSAPMIVAPSVTAADTAEDHARHSGMPLQSNTQSTLAALKNTVTNTTSRVSAVASDHEGRVLSTSKTDVVDAISFSLLIASAGPFLWVEHLPDALISREQLQLLQSIAVAVVGRDAQLGHRQFDWPLAKAPQLSKDLGTARQSVAGHLTRWAQQQTAQTLVVCGEPAREFVTEIPGLSQLFIPSLRDMLRTPALKRTAWQHLRPLTKQ